MKTQTLPWQRWIAIVALAAGLIMWDVDWGRDSSGCKANFDQVIYTP